MNKLVETSIQYLKGIGPKKAKSLNKGGGDTGPLSLLNEGGI